MQVINLKEDGSLVMRFDSARNQLIFRALNEDNTEEGITSYNANVMLSTAMRKDEKLREIQSFATNNGISLDETCSMESGDAYSSDLAAQIAGGLIRNAFPIYMKLFPHELLGDGFYGNAPVSSKRIIAAITATTFEDFIVGLFGEYRKDLARAVVAGDFTSVLWCSLFSGFVPADWIAQELTETRFRSAIAYRSDDEERSNLLSLLTRYQIRRLMRVSDSDDMYNLLESARLLSGIEASKVSLPEEITPVELHDHFSLIDAGVDENTVFDIPAKLEAIEGRTLNGLQSTILRSRPEYVETAKVMNNCAGSAVYTLDSIKNKSFLVRFDTENSEFKYLLELTRNRSASGWAINQLFGESNTVVSKQDTHDIHGFIERIINE